MELGFSALLGLAGAGASLVGSVVSGNAQAEQARTAAAAQRAQAAEEERKAKEVAASAQRDAIGQSRKADIANSRALAVAAASGGGASDPTVLDLMGDTAAQGEYNALSSLYNGDSQAAGLNQQAAIRRVAAENQIRAIPAMRTASLLGGISSFASSASRVGSSSSSRFG